MGKDVGGVADGGRSALTGCSVVSADGLAEAWAKSMGCPVHSSGGSVEVDESLPIG